MSPCPCECNSGGFCGGCGHAGCGNRQTVALDPGTYTGFLIVDPALFREAGKPTERDIALSGYSPYLRSLIRSSIETNPAMEETFLKIAELAYTEGQGSVD